MHRRRRDPVAVAGAPHGHVEARGQARLPGHCRRRGAQRRWVRCTLRALRRRARASRSRGARWTRD
eukprot:11104734-Alexandrium_andersonii.AAC.1